MDAWKYKIYFSSVLSRISHRSLRSLVRYPVQHAPEINFIFPRNHVIFSIYVYRIMVTTRVACNDVIFNIALWPKLLCEHFTFTKFQSKRPGLKSERNNSQSSRLFIAI